MTKGTPTILNAESPFLDGQLVSPGWVHFCDMCGHVLVETDRIVYGVLVFAFVLDVKRQFEGNHNLQMRGQDNLSCSVAPFSPFFWWLPH